MAQFSTPKEKVKETTSEETAAAKPVVTAEAPASDEISKEKVFAIVLATLLLNAY